MPYYVHLMLAKILKMDQSRIRMIKPHIGGGFGCGSRWRGGGGFLSAHGGEDKAAQKEGKEKEAIHHLVSGVVPGLPLARGNSTKVGAARRAWISIAERTRGAMELSSVQIQPLSAGTP